MNWAQRLKRLFAIDIEKCPEWGGKLRVIACIEDRQLIAKIAAHVRAREAITARAVARIAVRSDILRRNEPFEISLRLPILETPLVADGVSRLMQDVGCEYVRYINSTYKRSGTLWEGRFKSSLVDSAEYCLICYRYIELNPVRGAIVDSPDHYRWSSYRCNALGQKDELITPHEEWMAQGVDDRSRCAAHRALFDDAPKSPRSIRSGTSIARGFPWDEIPSSPRLRRD